MRNLKLSLAGAALVACVATSSSAQDAKYQAGFNFGPTWAMSGDSFLSIDDAEEVSSFKDDFDTGWGLGGFVAGPLSGMFGWRIEAGYDKMSADADRTAGTIDGDYKLFRYQGGIQIADFQGDAKGKPYAFVTLGGVHEDASMNTTIDGIDLQYDFDGRNAFGMSFGGGYNYLIGEAWGLGADLHVNAGFFDDATRWWWTPSAQLFFNW